MVHGVDRRRGDGLFVYFLFAYKEQKDVSHQITASITGIIYGAVMLMMLGLLHRDAGINGPYWFLLALVVTWSSDTGAYFSGKALGLPQALRGRQPQ